MPKLVKIWYPGKRPTLQIKLLKHIAIKGQLSQSEAIVEFGCKPSTISDAFKVLVLRKLIIKSIKPRDLRSGVRRRKIYMLSDKGLTAFISENPSPYEFWIAILWYCILNSKAIDQVVFNKYYNLFIQKFVGDSFPLRSCFFLSDSFDKLFKKWKERLERDDKIGATNDYHQQGSPTHAYKVIECLSQNRAITIERITALTQLTEQDVRKIIKDYSMTQGNYYHYIDLYDSVYQSDRSSGITTDFLNRLVIIPVKEEAAAKHEGQKFELSLLGILLTMGTISLRRRQGVLHYTYDKIASNYQDKLQLILGKWELLKQVLESRFDFYSSIFDYLFFDKYEILSLSTLLGGNKEIYDNIKSAALSTINKFFIIYDNGISAIDSEDFPKEFLKSEHFKLIQDKLHDIEILLRYSDLESFAKHMRSKRFNPSLIRLPPNTQIKDIPDWTFEELYTKYNINSQEDPDYFQDDLKFIENALADEFSLLFYIGLLRENNHKASDYPLTAGFIRPSPILKYAKHFLLDIVRNDDEIRKKVVEWVREATIYQKLTYDKVNGICEELEKQKLRKTNKN